jgi:transcriptional regulator with XRE-family HTH domain
MKQRAPSKVDFYFGKRLRMRRIELKISQTDLGEKLGVSFQQVQKYEKGTNRIGADRLQQIAAALEVPVAYFYDGAPGQPGFSADTATAGVSAFMTSRDGIAIARAFQRLPEDGHLRRIVRDLILGIVDGQAAMAAKAQKRRAA